ncbi:HlyD family efflux transporter periplasmic adaptor subunit [Parashewanella spongiae]|uniref:HlyD family efflux transporter periplasmic adaptor subunit n=1 Tax=Parashewanella spongiae TaxID=342950 RepID=A0A3A6U577_9GAMM|nr:HlyD family efflux transporter periplasmic adaptor subunit [Parashewanella spongiae]MCL1077198.1 HlyD family efflux transporter periplasmic adaptor subunit [Parashewanella spongiae]RJY19353.1 HlyD family efflux transporter periplasmic adaptor subunit [Parashewanella spongiae]
MYNKPLHCVWMFGFCLFASMTNIAAFANESPLLLTGKIASVESQSFTVPKAGDAWRYQIQWMMPEGTIAEVGQNVVVFDKSQINNKIEQLEANLLRVNAQEQSQTISLHSTILTTQFEVEQKQLELEKAQLDAAVPADFIAAKEYADNQFSLMKAQSSLTKAKQALKAAKEKQQSTLVQLKIDKQKSQLELTKALSDLDSLTLIAKLSGPVLYEQDLWKNKKYEVGDTVNIGRKVASIPAMDNLNIVAWVNEVDIDKIQFNQAVSIYLDAKPNAQFSGSINKISRQASSKVAWGESNWFQISVQFDDNTQISLLPGMSVLVETTPIMAASTKAMGSE